MRASEPVAMMMFLVSSVWRPCSEWTSTLPAPRKAARPFKTSTLFFRIRNSTPLVCLLTIWFLRSMTLEKSRRGLSQARPSAGFRKWSQSSAACSRALVGMQPTSRQVPPSLGLFSTSAVRSPYWPARTAAE